MMNMENSCGGGNCGEHNHGGCGGCHGHMGCGMKMHHLLRYVLMLLLLAIVFCFGFKIGELKGEMGNYRESSRGYGAWTNQDGYSPGMMQKVYNSAKQAPATKAEVKQ